MEYIEVVEHPENLDVCNKIVEMAKNVDPAYWIDKSKHLINYGVNGEIGKYDTLHYDCIPDDLKKLIDPLIPKNDRFKFNNYMINKYDASTGFIPFHSDLVETFSFSIITLTENKGDGFSYKTKDGEIRKVQDKIGNTITPKVLNLVHGVPDVVNDDRYVIITIYK